jgi:hypothetical protein
MGSPQAEALDLPQDLDVETHEVPEHPQSQHEPNNTDET